MVSSWISTNHISQPTANHGLKSNHVHGSQKADPTTSVQDKHHALAKLTVKATSSFVTTYNLSRMLGGTL